MATLLHGEVMKFHASHALLPDGVHANVRIEADGGLIRLVEHDVVPTAGDHIVRGLVLPGMANVHSHAFQRAMAGLAEWDAGGRDNFWSWREAMYRFAERLDPSSQLAIARYLYIEMLKAGYTSVGEFHYLHNRPGGQPYAPDTQMSEAIAEAAKESGIALTFLPTLYVTGGADGRALNERQKRFGRSVEEILRLRDDMRDAEGVTAIGLALHSLRAVPPELMHDAIDAVEATSPIHIHAAEQEGEVEESLAAFGERPVEYLLHEFGCDARWCLVHSTHLSEDETHELAASGAIAGLCPSTEGNLGDGIFPLTDLLNAGGAFAIGGDSHVCVDPAEELKQLEYVQRLVHRRRNVAATRSEAHTAARLWGMASRSGAQALGLKAGAIMPGKRADLIVVDTGHVSLEGRDGAQALDSYVFVAGRSAVRDVMVGGRWVVNDRRHLGDAAAERDYRDAVLRILAG